MIGRTLPVQWDGRRVRLLDARTKQLLIEYETQVRGRYRTPDEYRPPRTPATTLQLLAWCRCGSEATDSLIHDSETIGA